MLKNNYLNIVLLAFMTVFSACKKEYEAIEPIDDVKINDYIKKNNLSADMKKDPSGFYYQITSAGTGKTLLNTDSVFFYYNLKSLTGTVYKDFSPLMPTQDFVGYISLSPFRKTLLKLGMGGSANIIIPSHLAFGKNGSGNIPSNEVIFSTIKVLPYHKRHLIDDYLIDKFNTDNGLGLVKDASRCYYKIITPGTGKTPIGPYSIITANYVVRTLNGAEKDSSADQKYVARLDVLYRGWRQMLPGKLTAGGKMRLVVPSDLISNNGIVPLDFDIEIIKVEN